MPNQLPQNCTHKSLMSETVFRTMLQQGLISESDLKEAYRIQQVQGGTLSLNLICIGAIDDRELAQFYSRYLDLRILTEPHGLHIQPHVFTCLPTEVIFDLGIMPIHYTNYERDNLIVGIIDVTGYSKLEEASFFAELELVPRVISAGFFCRNFERLTELSWRISYSKLQQIRQNYHQHKSQAEFHPPSLNTPSESELLSEEYRELFEQIEPLDSIDAIVEGSPICTEPVLRIELTSDPPPSDSQVITLDRIKSITDTVDQYNSTIITPKNALVTPETKTPLFSSYFGKPKGLQNKKYPETYEVISEQPNQKSSLQLSDELQAISDALLLVEDKDLLGHILNTFLARLFARIAILTIKKNIAQIWRTSGFDTNGNGVDDLLKRKVHLSKIFCFQKPAQSQTIFWGFPNREDKEALNKLFDIPPHGLCMVVPVTLHNRTLLLLYIENDDQPIPREAIEIFTTLAENIQRALKQIIITRKNRKWTLDSSQ